jgi:hypothetical protein
VKKKRDGLRINGNMIWVQKVGEEVSQEEDNRRIYLRVLGCENVRWMKLAQDYDQWC